MERHACIAYLWGIIVVVVVTVERYIAHRDIPRSMSDYIIISAKIDTNSIVGGGWCWTRRCPTWKLLPLIRRFSASVRCALIIVCRTSLYCNTSH